MRVRAIRIFVIMFAVFGGTMGYAGNVADGKPDYSNLTAGNHPRVIYTNDDFAAIVKQLADGTNPYLNDIHGIIMDMAYSCLDAPALERNIVGGRLINVCREGEKRILSCAYAYKTTGDRKFLDRAVSDMQTVCNFEDWYAAPSFLGAGELTAAVGLAYDWLYNDLTDVTKNLVRKALNDFAFHPALYERLGTDFHTMKNNWNSVCNGGLVCAALAVYEDSPEIAQNIIDRALETNVAALKVCYSPDGNYSEGYMYWNFGTVYETLLLTAMETATGSDAGLSGVEGFSETGKYMIHMEGSSGYCFNFSDCYPYVNPCLAQWYFAWKFGDLPVLYKEKDKIASKYKSGTESRVLPLVAWYVSKVRVSDIPAPEEHVYYGRGVSPVVLVHDTWTMGGRDMSLGIKAGKAGVSHGHMDAGSFIFDADGLRWASDLGVQGYAELEGSLKIWDMKDGSERWQVFRYNNFNHNTLTVNDAYHKVGGAAEVLDVLDSDEGRGAVLDMTAPLFGEVSSAVRTVCIRDGCLVVEDKISALDDKPAYVRWTMVTPAKPEINDGVITLTQRGKTRCLTCASSTGHEVEWATWSTHSPNSWDASNEGFYECGYTVTINQGDTAVMEVRLAPAME